MKKITGDTPSATLNFVTLYMYEYAIFLLKDD